MTGNHRTFDREWRLEAICAALREGVVDRWELPLFEWYADENESVVDKMLSVEQDFVRQQTVAGRDCVDDSGIVAVEYYIKRARYAAVIYMTSLLETYLSRACEMLNSILGRQNVHFQPNELAGDKWTRRRKFLERYGNFQVCNSTWSEIETLIFIRNILVHENGDPAAISQSDRRRIKNCKGVIVGQTELVIEKEYIASALSSIRSLIDFVDGELESSFNRALCPQSVLQP